MHAAPHVILVDDDAAVRSAVAFAFETEGFLVSAFANAEEALAARLPAAPSRPSGACFVLDQHLPGMNGLELLSRLRARGEAAPAVLITSNPRHSLCEQARGAGAPIIEKPLLGDALASTVKRMLLEAWGA